jgi:hypothetical protein
MTLVDKGTGADLEFGHTDYKTGEGRFVTHSENIQERYINPELTPKERNLISIRDMMRRNQTKIYLWNGNNVRIAEYVYYNHATEDLSLSWSVFSHNGKKLFDITPVERDLM